MRWVDRPELFGFLLAAIVAVCGTVLAFTGHPTPGELWLLGGGGVGSGATAIVPKGRRSA